MKEILILNSIWAGALSAFCAIIVFSCLLRATYAAVAPPKPYRDFRVRLVKCVILAEAQGEGTGGMLRVAEVIRNRSKRKNEPAVNIVSAPFQFSCLNKRDSQKDFVEHVESTSPQDPQDYAQELARMLVFGSPDLNSDLTKGATHYYRAGTRRPKWALGFVPVHSYKNHIFFKLD